MNLAIKITEELVKVIQATLPDLERKIDSQLYESREKLDKLPPPIPEGNHQKLTYLLDIIKNMSRDVSIFLSTGEVGVNGRNIFHLWRKYFRKFADEIKSIRNKSMSTEFSLPKLKEEISERRGNEINGFLNFKLFEKLISNHVRSYKSVAISSVEEVKNKTVSLLYEIINNNIIHLPIIVDELKKIIVDQLDLACRKSLKRIDVIFEEEKLIYATDESIDKEMNILETANSASNTSFFSRYIYILNRNSSHMDWFSQRRSYDANEMYNLITCYLKIVHIRLSDRIPMTIRQCLHIELSKILDREFIQYSNNEDIIRKVIENKNTDGQRKTLRKKIERLKLAKSEIRKILIL